MHIYNTKIIYFADNYNNRNLVKQKLNTNYYWLS
jgi:hypothetical protein